MMDSERTCERTDRYSRACLTAIVVLLALGVAGLWSGRLGAGPQVAEAQPVPAHEVPGAVLPNSAVQRDLMIVQLRQISDELA